DIGFDSLLEAPAMHRAKSYRETAANALTRHAPPKFIRTVVAQREPFDATNVEHYELWLRSILERQTDFVFIDGWNAWSDGAYLEPDDRDGRAFLNATRRATRGLSSGKVLVRRRRPRLSRVRADRAARRRQRVSRLPGALRLRRHDSNPRTAARRLSRRHRAAHAVRHVLRSHDAVRAAGVTRMFENLTWLDD